MASLSPGVYEIYHDTPSNLGLATGAEHVYFDVNWTGSSYTVTTPLANETATILWNWRVVSETSATVPLTLRVNSAIVDTFTVPGLSDSLESGVNWSGLETAVNGDTVSVSAPAGYSIAQGPTSFLPATVSTPPNPDEIGGDAYLVVYRDDRERRQVTVRLVVKDSTGTGGENVIAQMSNDLSIANELMRVPSIANGMNSQVWIGEVEDGVAFDLVVPAGGVVLVSDSSPVSASKTNFYYLVEFPKVVGGTPAPGTAVTWDKDGDGAPDTTQYTDDEGNSSFINTPDLNSPVVVRPGSGTGTPNTGGVIGSVIGSGTDNQLLKAILNEVSGLRQDIADKEIPFTEAPGSESVPMEDTPMMDTTGFHAGLSQLNPFDKFTIGTTEPPVLELTFDLPFYGEIDLSYDFATEPVVTWVALIRAFLLLLITIGATMCMIRLFSKALSSI